MGLSSFALAQSPSSHTNDTSFIQTFGKPLFIYNTYNFTSDQPGKSRLDVFIAFVNDILQFVKANDGLYQAKYEIVLEIMDENGNGVAGDILQKDITTTNFEETNSRNVVNMNQFTFHLAPGNYQLHLEITDLDTKRHLTRKKKIALKDFQTEGLAISDLLLYDEIQLDSTGFKQIKPNMRRTMDEPNAPFGAYFELYNQTGDSLWLYSRVYDFNNQSTFNREEVFAPAQKFIRKMLPLKDSLKISGNYVLFVEARTHNKKVAARENFFVQFQDDQNFQKINIKSDLVWPALKYITPSNLFSKIAKASPPERERLINQFWQERDPTPETVENELKEEFYHRVAFTIQHFSINSENKLGWGTDRGKIYIIYGPPSEVQRRSVEIGANPFEVWYYKKIDRRFIFMDKSGTGDYKLVHQD